MKPNRLAYSISEVCALTTVGRTTLYAAIKSGDLRTRKVGRRTLITAHDLDDWLASRPLVRTGALATTTPVASDIASNAMQS